MARDKRSKRFLTTSRDSYVEPKKERSTSPTTAGSLATYIVALKPDQLFSITYRADEIITVYADNDGNIYPEKLRDALKQGILQRK